MNCGRMNETPSSDPESILHPPQPMRVPLPLTKPLLTWIILVLNSAIWLLMTLGGGSTDTSVLVRFGAKVSWLVAAGEYWRLLSAIFLHIGLPHLLFNSYALYSLGPQVEGLFGRNRFLALYLCSGVAGSTASYIVSTAVSAGASGAIFGLIGALTVYLMRHRDMLGRRGKRALGNVLFVILYNLIFSFTVPGIDLFGHLGGLVGGLVVGGMLCPDYTIVVDSHGAPEMVDRNSLRRQAWRFVAVCVALIIGAGLGTLRWRNSAEVYLLRGLDLLEERAFVAALNEFEQAADMEPDNAQVVFYLGVAHHELGQYAAAAKAYEHALSIESELSEARWNLALTYVAQAHYQDAIEQFQIYLATVPDQESATQARVWIARLKDLSQP